MNSRNQTQNQASNFTLMSQKKNFKSSFQANNQTDVLSVVTDHLMMADQKHESQRCQLSCQHKESIDSQTAEIQALKNQITSLEQTALLEQEEKADLEQALKVVSSITSLANAFKLLFQQLQLKIRETNKARRERHA